MPLEDEIEEALSEDLLHQFLYPQAVNAMVTRLCIRYHKPRAEMDAMVRHYFKQAVGDGMLEEVFVNYNDVSSSDTVEKVEDKAAIPSTAAIDPNANQTSTSNSASVNRRRRSPTPVSPRHRASGGR